MNSSYQNDNEYTYGSADMTLALPGPQTRTSTSREGEFTAEDYRTALRLLVGAALEGTDELRIRIEPWWADVQEWERESGASLFGVEEKGGSPLLFILLGLLFKTPDYLSRGISTVGRVSSRATSIVSRLLRPITNSRVMRPVQRRYRYFVARGESEVNSLKFIGRSEARTSRALIRQEVNEDTIEDILAYLVEKAKIRDLIAEQGVEAAGDVSTEIRVRSAAVDSSLDNIVDNILRRQKLQKPPSR